MASTGTRRFHAQRVEDTISKAYLAMLDLADAFLGGDKWEEVRTADELAQGLSGMLSWVREQRAKLKEEWDNTPSHSRGPYKEKE